MPFIDTRTLPVKEPLPGWKGRYFSSAHMTFGYYTVTAGASIHPHAHENEEVWHVIDGEIEVMIGDEAYLAGPGAVAVVPANTVHSVKAVSDARAIVVDSPHRHAIGGVSTD